MVVLGTEAQSSKGCQGGSKFKPKLGESEEIRFELFEPTAGHLVNRTIRFYTPKNYDPFQPSAVVLDFHGYYDNSSIEEEQTGWTEIADEYNFFVVWPNGFDDTIGKLFGTDLQAFSWNAVGTTASPGPLGITCNWTKSPKNNYPCHGTCIQEKGCRNLFDAAGCDCTTCADDKLFTNTFLDWIEESVCVDLNRVHVTGMSNGAMMTYDLATMDEEVSNRIASIVPFSGSPLVGFCNPPKHHMAVMDVHGIEDDVIPANYSNGHGRGPHSSVISEDGFYYTPTNLVLGTWASYNKCKGDVQHYRTKYDGETDLYCWTPHGADCTDGTAVVQCTHNLGHTWPFENNTAGRARAALLAWDFFAQHPRVASKTVE